MSRYGTKVFHPRSVKQVIADIEMMMRDEVEGSPGHQQLERALNYWWNGLKKKKGGKDVKAQS